MRMKTMRKLQHHPPFMHTCDCQNQPEYLIKLPAVQSDCVNAHYWARGDHDEWIDITDDTSR